LEFGFGKISSFLGMKIELNGATFGLD